MARTTYKVLKGRGFTFWSIMTLHALVILIGLGATYYMEHNGHIVTGMNNRIVWGMPHVFAIFLIIAASGALNVASISSVFNKLAYKSFARLSGLLALALLVGGLAVLVLDLGRPDRLIVAMTKYNFKSIFAWNIYLYIGFMVIVAGYLFVQMSRGTEHLTKPMGIVAFAWRLILTTGTGSIFGFLVARDFYDTAIMAPLFIATSFLFGLAFTILVLSFTCFTIRNQLMTREVMQKFRDLLIIFIVVVLYFTAVHHLNNIYITQHHGVEKFLLLDSPVYSTLFWGGQIILGSILPLLILTNKSLGSNRSAMTLASIMILIGGLAQIYVIVIGGQAYPLEIFPGWDEISSSYGDGQIANYMPSLPEILLGVTGISLAMFITGFVLTILPFLPEPISDE